MTYHGLVLCIAVQPKLHQDIMSIQSCILSMLRKACGEGKLVKTENVSPKAGVKEHSIGKFCL